MKYIVPLAAVVLLVITFTGCYHTKDSTGPSIEYTDLPGELTGTLSLSGSPYAIVEDSYVPEGSVLNVEAGVEIRFAGFYTLTVEGYLNAVGTPEKFITFGSTYNNNMNDRGNWEGIIFTNSSQSSILEYCKIEDGAKYINGNEEVRGAIQCFSSSPVIRKCLLVNNGYSAIYAVNRIDYIFDADSNLVEVIQHPPAAPLIDGCTITGNAYSGVVSDSGAVPLVRNCIIVTNDDYGVFAVLNSHAAPRIEYCNIWDNFTTEVFGIDTSGFPGILSKPEDDPQFVDPANGDYHLQSHSPCIDAGDVSAIKDIDETRRDMGVFFYDQSDPSEIRGALKDLWSNLKPLFPQGKDTLIIEYSPYLATCTIYVEEGDTLVIEPGVEIRINAQTYLRFSFNIYGTLIAMGEEGNEIVITSSKSVPQKGDWKYLHFDTTSTGSQISHCQISYTSEILIEADITVDSSSFKDIEKYVKIINTTSTLDYNIFDNIGLAGLICEDEADPVIKHCLFYQSQGYGIHCTGHSDPVIQNNIFLENLTHGVRCDTFSAPQIINNTFAANGYYGIYLLKNSDATIRNNIVSYNAKGGIVCAQASEPDMYYNDSFGHLMVDIDSVLLVDPVTLDSTWEVSCDSTWWDYYNCPDFVGELSGVNANQDSCDIFFNISFDPLIEGAATSPLPGNSPCVNAGDPVLSDPDGTVSDMGAFGGPEGDWTPPIITDL